METSVQPTLLSIVKHLYRSYLKCPADPGITTISPDADDLPRFRVAVQEVLDHRYAAMLTGRSSSALAVTLAVEFPLCITEHGRQYIEVNRIDPYAPEIDYSNLPQ